MFRKTIYKIIAAIMGILIILFIGTLSIIYYSSYRQVYKSNMEMLKTYADAYWENGNPDDHIEPELREDVDLDKRDPDKADKREDGLTVDNSFLSAAFYSVAFSKDGEIISIDNDESERVSDDALTEICEGVKDTGDQNGNLKEWIYYISEEDETTLVVLMDNVLVSSSITTLFKNTLIYGGIVLVLLNFPAVFLAFRIVRPLEENDKKQKQFISDASHELKTPVAVISTNAEMLSREIGENKWLSNIQYENRQMGDLVIQLLNLARVENRSPMMKNVNLSQIVMGSVLPFEGIAFDKNIELQNQISENIYVNGNEEQIGILVSILVDNALEYTWEKGIIEVLLRREHRVQILEVSNDGTPIPKQVQEHLFERFYRENDEREHESGHYGLGLAIAKAIVESHNGKIEVECLDGKVIFRVKFPESKKKEKVK